MEYSFALYIKIRQSNNKETDVVIHVEYLSAYPSSMLFSLSFFYKLCYSSNTLSLSPPTYSDDFFWYSTEFYCCLSCRIIYMQYCIDNIYDPSKAKLLIWSTRQQYVSCAHIISANAVVGYLSCCTSLYIFSAPLGFKWEGCVNLFSNFEGMTK